MRCKDEPNQLEVHMDFCFPGEEKDGRKLTILVVRERSTRMTMSAVAPTKSSGEFLAKRVCAFLREIGADKGDITIKTDQEPAILAVVNEVARHRAVGHHAPVNSILQGSYIMLVSTCPCSIVSMKDSIS